MKVTRNKINTVKATREPSTNTVKSKKVKEPQRSVTGQKQRLVSALDNPYDRERMESLGSLSRAQLCKTPGPGLFLQKQSNSSISKPFTEIGRETPSITEKQMNSPQVLRLFLSNAQTILGKRNVDFKQKHKLFNATQPTMKYQKSND